MTQKDLLCLIGLPVTDQRLINFFGQRNLTLPASVSLANPGSRVDAGRKSMGVTDKEWGFSYYFSSEILNENFPVVKNGRSYIPYLSQIIFSGKPYQKRTVNQAEEFWNVSPEPNSEIERMEHCFGNFDRSKKFPNRHIPFGETAEIIVTLITEENRLSNYFARIPETYEYLHPSQFETKWNNQKVNLYCMLIKWLFDNRYLASKYNTFPASLNNNSADVLHFIKSCLNGHLWENQLTKEDHLSNFVLQSLSHQLDFKERFYEAWGKLDYYQGLDYEEQCKWNASVPFDEATYSVFHLAMNNSFDGFRERKAQ